MPRLMQTTGRFALLLVALALLAAACTGGGADDPNGNGNVDASPDGSPTVTVTGPPGTAVYRYANAGLVATLQLKGTGGTLEIDNDTGRTLPKPDFYILDARDGHRIEGKVADPAEIPDGERVRFDVSFSGIELRNIGLVLLLFGRDNYGAFVRQ